MLKFILLSFCVMCNSLYYSELHKPRAATGEHGGVWKVLGIKVVRDTVMWWSG